MIPLRIVLALAAAGVVAVLLWSFSPRNKAATDGRQEIVCWGITYYGDDVYTLVHQFEKANPQYKVVISASVERDTTADAQRLLSAIAGGVPPDVVFFPRHATGEWASRNALADLRPMLDAQSPDDPHRLDLSQYYGWAVNEASYRTPGTDETPRVYGIPVTADIRVLYANGDVLRQNGMIDARGQPRPPRTWEELRQAAVDLTVFRTPGDPASGIERLGFAPNYGNSWLYLYTWQAGGSFLSADGTRITMDSPPAVRALRYMMDVYDALGGVGQVDAFKASQQTGDLDPFLGGRVALKIDNDYALRTIADWRPDMDFLIAPAPMPADEMANGREPVTWAGGFSLVIPATSRNQDGAFKLIQYLTSWDGVHLLEQGKRERQHSEGRMYLPEGLGNRVFFERLVKEAIFDNPQVPKRFREAYTVLQELMPRTLHRPVTPVGQLLWNQHVRAFEAGVNHTFAAQARAQGVDEARLALATMQRDVQNQLDEILRPPPPTRVNWRPYFIGYAALIATPFALMAIVYRQRKREYGYRAREVRAAMLFISPWVVGFTCFVGGPILFSVVLSFTRYDVLSPARYVGLQNYLDVFRDELFYQSLVNTAVMMVRIPIGMGISLGVAMLLNRAIGGIGLYRTLFFMPAIVPLIATALLWTWLFNPAYGPLNALLAWLFDAVGVRVTLPLWLNDPAWSKPSLIVMNLWTAGAGIIIWLAGLQSIPPQLYEAASIDGASPFRRFTNVTVPMLSPYILFNFIIGLIATMQVFVEAYIMTSGGPADSTLFYAYHLFKQAFQFFRMGYASALAWILFAIVLALTVVQLLLSKRWVHYEHQ